MTPRSLAILLGAAVLISGLAGAALITLTEDEIPTFEQQACSLPPSWLERTQRGYLEPRSGQIAILPEQPAYMARGEGGWSHSGPWPYLQHVPLVVYGPGMIPARGEVGRSVTVADIAPTIATLLRGSVGDFDGELLREAASLDAEALSSPRPRLILTIVWDGGGWNTLAQWPGDWANLASMIEGGVSYGHATAGSNPSITPSVHSTIGTGVFPRRHGVTGIHVRDEDGVVVDSFLRGESSRFLQVPTIAERWDELNDNEALVGMLGYEPWHLGMIGQGAERPGGDRDHAMWPDVETNVWETNPEHYSLPESVADTTGLGTYLDDLDAADGEVDEAWLDHEILSTPDRWEETPAFIRFHRDALFNLIRGEGYGDDDITDLLFTNFKQIDRVGHYFNMESEEVNQSILVSDEILGDILRFLEREVGRGRYVVILTADHGQQPDAPDVNGYGINNEEVKSDLNEEFGEIVRVVWPTEVFLFEDEMEERGVTVEEVAGFLSRYTLKDNLPAGGEKYTGAFHSDDRLFRMAIPARLLTTLQCSG